jgi:hypothetical protein
MKARKLFTALAALAIVGSAAGISAASATSIAEPDTTFRVKSYVRVVNNNWLDVNIYAVSGGRSWRLGTDRSFQEVDFEIPRWLMSGSYEITLVTDPIGSRTANISNTVIFTPGDVVQLNVENAINMTNAWIIGTTVGVDDIQ